MTPKFKLKLYITGRNPKSGRVILNLQHICKEQLKDQCEIEVIDALEHPQLAEGDRILATPTVIKELPLPVRRIIGDLSDSEKVLLGLDIMPWNNGNGKNQQREKIL